MTKFRAIAILAIALLAITVGLNLASGDTGDDVRSAGDHVREYGGNTDDHSAILHELRADVTFADAE